MGQLFQNPDELFRFLGRAEQDKESSWEEVTADGRVIVATAEHAKSLEVTDTDACIVVGTMEELVAGQWETRWLPVALPVTEEQFQLFLANRRGELAVRGELNRQLASPVLSQALQRARFETKLLLDAGRALALTHDVEELLEEILAIARKVTGADAGSIYVIEDDENGKAQLCFHTSQNDSIEVEIEGFCVPITGQSIVGACVLSKKQICIDDLYGEDGVFHHDRSFDEQHHYQTRSMLTVPLLSAGKDVIGVVQLINRKAPGKTSPLGNFDEDVVPFPEDAVEMANALCIQAGLALENTFLYKEVRDLFESFVEASVTAIEARDPTTSGHSRRVSDLTLGLARAMEMATGGPYRDTCFTANQMKEIEYASLLHDFGKVGVREHVLVKAKKLYPHEEELVRQRFELAYRSHQVDYLSRRMELVQNGAPSEKLELLEHDWQQKQAWLDESLKRVLSANEPTVLEQGDFDVLTELAGEVFTSAEGSTVRLLRDNELLALQVRRGSLTPDERREIESHVSLTYEFLQHIPWGKNFSRVPEIAGSHHEKLTGKGYPRALTEREIPLESRMMTISDIYDALTASDRPYKRALPREKALDILGYERKDGNIDGALLDIFIDAKVYERV